MIFSGAGLNVQKLHIDPQTISNSQKTTNELSKIINIPQHFLKKYSLVQKFRVTGKLTVGETRRWKTPPGLWPTKPNPRKKNTQNPTKSDMRTL